MVLILLAAVEVAFGLQHRPGHRHPHFLGDDDSGRRTLLPGSKSWFAEFDKTLKTFVTQHQDLLDNLCLAAVICAGVVLLATIAWVVLYFTVKRTDPLDQPHEVVPIPSKKAMIKAQLAAIAAEEQAEDDALDAEIAQMSTGDDRTPEEVEVDMRIAELEAKKLIAGGVARLIPVVRRVSSVKAALEDRLEGVKKGSAEFLRKELMDSAVEVVDALAVKGTRPLLDKDWPTLAKSWNLPSMGVILSGLAAPAQLQMFKWTNLSVLLVFSVLFAVLLWAAIADTLAYPTCDIPTAYWWIWAQVITIFILVLVRSILAAQVEVDLWYWESRCQRAKTEFQQIMQDRASGKIGELEYVRQLIVHNMAQSAYALMLWDDIGNSPLSWALLVGIIFFLVVGFWGFVLMVGWMVVPGQVAFAPEAEGRAELFCGAWRIVLVARIFSIVLSVFLFFFLLNVISGTTSVMLQSRSFGLSMLEKSEQVDKKLGGFPVFSTMVKSFLLRENVDNLAIKKNEAKLAEALLATQTKKLDSDLASAEADYEANQAAIAALKQQLADAPMHPRLKAKIQKFERDLKKDMEQWQTKVVDVIPPPKSIDPIKDAVDEGIDQLASAATFEGWGKEQKKGFFGK
mmetsp:Transcript_9120/g.21861  ORF Transcript_9120/g.21861 Transcript_9120/m.21861 type:complete len:626 (+) Transcript_9120:98-1975(+)